MFYTSFEVELLRWASRSRVQWRKSASSLWGPKGINPKGETEEGALWERASERAANREKWEMAVPQSERIANAAAGAVTAPL